MQTKVESLPIEIWLMILRYLDIRDIIRALSNVNTYFDRILRSNYFSIDFELKDDEKIDETVLSENSKKSYLSDSILNRIICLRSSAKTMSKTFSEFYCEHGPKLTRLQSLSVTADFTELSSVCLIIEKSNLLEYLSLKCIPNQHLLESIVNSQSIRICQLEFWRSTTHFKPSLNAVSSIEKLRIRLQDDSNHSIMKFLLSNMKKLKTLEIIEENFLNNDTHPLLFEETSIYSCIESVQLKWGYHDIRSNCFQNLFSKIPMIKSLSLTMFYVKFSQALFDNLIESLFPILKFKSSIKINIHCHRLIKTNEINLQAVFDDYCRYILHKFNSCLNRFITIRCFQESPKKHKIQIIV